METKKCCHCKEDLSLDSFQKNRAAPDGLQYRCKNCTKKAHILCRAKRGHLWQEKLNPWKDRPDNRERVNATTRARMARKPIEEKREESYRWILKRKYGLTPELKMALIAAQDNVCAICERPIDFKCATDHDHEGDFVRGMLCKPCNSALGLFKDDPKILRKAAKYLEESKEIVKEPNDEDFDEATRILEEVKKNHGSPNETQSVTLSSSA